MWNVCVKIQKLRLDLQIGYTVVKWGHTGKSFSEVHILALTNPQYDKRLSIEFTSSVHENTKLRTWEYMRSVQKLFFVFVLTFKTTYVSNMFSPCSKLRILMYWTGKSMDNLLSYCGLADVRISASEKDLPVPKELSITIYVISSDLFYLIESTM